MFKNNLAKEESYVQNSKPLLHNEYLNLPDSMFYLFCKERFQLNRGNYHTIERWFYDQGINNLVFRRIYILAFLDFVTRERSVQMNSYIKFGKGGLSAKLREFFESL